MGFLVRVGAYVDQYVHCMLLAILEFKSDGMEAWHGLLRRYSQAYCKSNIIITGVAKGKTEEGMEDEVGTAYVRMHRCIYVPKCSHT